MTIEVERSKQTDTRDEESNSENDIVNPEDKIDKKVIVEDTKPSKE